MEKAKKAQLPIRKIIGICLILLFVMSVGVMASNAKLYNVKIILSNGYIMNVTTSKTKVSEIPQRQWSIYRREALKTNPNRYGFRC